MASGALAIAGLSGLRSRSASQSLGKSFARSHDRFFGGAPKRKAWSNRAAAAAVAALRNWAAAAAAASRNWAAVAAAASRNWAAAAAASRNWAAAVAAASRNSGGGGGGGVKKLGGGGGGGVKKLGGGGGGGFKGIKAGGTGHWMPKGHQLYRSGAVRTLPLGQSLGYLRRLSALTVLAAGGASYYPYAYISAPAPACVGLNEDGCELRWQEVETLKTAGVPMRGLCSWQ